MKPLSYVYILVLISSCCGSHSTTVFIKDQPTQRVSYPEWHLLRNEFNVVGKLDSEFQWKMNAREKGTKNIVDSIQFLLPVQQNVPITIEVSSKKGYPVIMLTDRMLHKNDLYTVINGLDKSVSFPGRPLAYSIGNDNTVTLCIKPQSNKVLTAWIWLLEGQMNYEEYEKGVEEIDKLDTTEISIPIQMLRLNNLRDSLNHYNYLEKAWNNEGVVSKKRFKKSKVTVNIHSGINNCSPLKDYFYELYNYKGVENGIEHISGLKWDDIREWYEITEELDNRKSKFIKSATDWKKAGVSFQNKLFDISLETRLKIIENVPILQDELLKREYIYNLIQDSTTLHKFVNSQIALEGGEVAILKNELSGYLLDILPSTGCLSAAVYDRYGYIVASTTPFTYVNIKNQPEWEKLEAIGQQLVISECYNLSGYAFRLKKVFIPLKKIDLDEPIGWLMAEVYCN